MKKSIVLNALLAIALLGSCQKSKVSPNQIPPALPRTEVPASLQGGWMYGQFSMTEYWTEDPGTYIGNALQFAIAFKFYADGSYEQYFTSRTAGGFYPTYQQSVTRGLVEVNEANKTITTHAYTSHYRRMSNGQVLEDRDLAKSELSGPTVYTYTNGNEPSGTKAIYLKMQGTSNALTFLQKL